MSLMKIATKQLWVSLWLDMLYLDAICPKTTIVTFQRAMGIILSSVKWQFVIFYLDDIVLISKSPEEYIDHIQQVLRY